MDALPETVGIVGCGLIGTSLALALRQIGIAVLLADQDPREAQLAAARSGGLLWDHPPVVPIPAAPADALAPGFPPAHAGEGGAAERTGAADRSPAPGVIRTEPDVLCPEPDIIFACVPPAAVPVILAAASRLYPRATLSDVASVKSYLEAELEAWGVDPGRWIGGHPVAGRERSGAAAGRSDLFAGRAWALCPGAGSDPERLRQVADLVAAVGATPVVLSATEHDRALALLSHLPQLLASTLATVTGQLPAALFELAGPGYLDMTRLADSPPQLWAQIAAANSAPLAAALDSALEVLGQVRAELTEPERSARAVAALVSSGSAGRRHLRVKGRPERLFGRLSVVLRDRPGELAAVLGAAAAAGVNIEDIDVDHAPHQPAGIVELAVSAEQVEHCRQVLQEGGWQPFLKPEET